MAECGNEVILPEEETLLLLPDTDPVQFSQFLEHAYGFRKTAMPRSRDLSPKDPWDRSFTPETNSDMNIVSKTEEKPLEVKIEVDVDNEDEDTEEDKSKDAYPWYFHQSDVSNIKTDKTMVVNPDCPMNGCAYNSINSFEELNLHLKLYHNSKNKPRICDICNKVCLRKSVYIIHMRDAHFQHVAPDPKSNKVKVYRCKHCEEEYDSIEEKNEHMRQVHPGKIKKRKKKEISCPQCVEIFTTKKDLKRHLINVHGVKKKTLENAKPREILCPSCGEICFSKRELRIHASKVHGEGNEEAWNGKVEPNCEKKKHQCFKCFKEFANDKYMWVHIDDKHPEVRNPQELLCNLCGATFTVRPKLNSHMEKFHMMGNKKYQCKYCDFRTLTSHVLMEHERTHTDERPEVCQWCGKGFKARKTLRNHERLHTGEKPFKCKFCDSAFVQRTSLNVHQQSHHKHDLLMTQGLPPHSALGQTMLQRNSRGTTQNDAPPSTRDSHLDSQIRELSNFARQNQFLSRETHFPAFSRIPQPPNRESPPPPLSHSPHPLSHSPHPISHSPHPLSHSPHPLSHSPRS